MRVPVCNCSRMSFRVDGIRLGAIAIGFLAISVFSTGALAQENKKATSKPAKSKAKAESARVAVSTEPEQDRNPSSISAVVNGEEITRAQLGKECVARFGEEVLQKMVNKMLIMDACEKQGVKITEGDVNKEVARIAQRFGLPLAQYMQLLKDERNMDPSRYKNDVVWPTLALRALASEVVEVTDEEIDREFEAEYGPRVKIRIIGVSKEKLAKEVRAQAVSDPDSFPELAKKYCEDSNLASVGGLVPPIRKNIGDATLEKIAFALKDGEISKVFELGGNFFVLKCEGHEEARDVSNQQYSAIRKILEEKVHDGKLRQTASSVFQTLQDAAKGKIINVMNNPELRSKQPGVAASVNGKAITIGQVTDEAIAQYGEDILEGEINRKVLEQALRNRNLQVVEADLKSELTRNAEQSGMMGADGKGAPDKLLKQIADEGGQPDLYIRDVAWPSAALRKMVKGTVKVGEDEIKKGFESNFGPRVEVLAIVVGSQREAQKVWEMARNNNSAAFFGQLASEYSIEPTSRANQGKVPEIRKYGGQPALEEEAFKLKAGEMSGVVAMADKFVILRCVGHIKPDGAASLNDKALRAEITADITEKATGAAMANEFDRLREMAQVDNYLKNSSSTGKRRSESGEARSARSNDSKSRK